MAEKAFSELPLVALLEERYLKGYYNVEHAGQLRTLLQTMPYELAFLHMMEKDETRLWMAQVVAAGLLPRPHLFGRLIKHSISEAFLQQCLIEGDVKVEHCMLFDCMFKGNPTFFRCFLVKCEGSAQDFRLYHSWATALSVEAQNIDLSASYIHSGILQAKHLVLGYHSQLGKVDITRVKMVAASHEDLLQSA